MITHSSNRATPDRAVSAFVGTEFQEFGVEINAFAEFINQTWTASEFCSQYADAAIVVE
jgi:hypothetical protein